MSNPDVRTLICPTCQRHAPTIDGRFMAHPATDGSGANCPSTGRSVLPETGGDRSPGSAFESCPAATGEPSDHSGCQDFPDGAHRCGYTRTHMKIDARAVDERTHRCTCGYEWTSLRGSLRQLHNMYAVAERRGR
jgi:hypothetical protein